MKFVIAMSAIATLLAGCANNEPAEDQGLAPSFAFRTLSQNATLAQAAPLLGPCNGQGGERLCPLKDSVVAGARARVAVAVFDDFGFKALRVAWTPADHKAVARNLTEAYGTPCSDQTSSLRTTGYETLTNITTTWCFLTGSLTLEKYTDNFTATRLTYLSSRTLPAAHVMPRQPAVPQTL
jgi:hypothetical protein